MSTTALAWGSAQRFYLPNEDARPVAAALASVQPPARAPVFVGGSGFLLLEATARAAPDAAPTFVDVAPFQAYWFRQVTRALEAAAGAADLQRWFTEELHPRLATHYQARGQGYSLDAVLRASEELFGLSLLRDDARLALARRLARDTTIRCQEISDYLATCDTRHDFIYLSNVPDYLDPAALRRLLEACRRHGAPVYALITSAGPAPEALRAAAAGAGLALDPGSCVLDGQNRGLGARTLDRPWNRPGTILLFQPAPPSERAP
jgi:hypothetical protein